MRRVAITGIGIVSSIGNNVSEVTNSLRSGTSGIVAAPEYTELGFRSQVHGTVKLDVADHVDRKQLRFMGEGAAYAVLAMEQAIADAGLEDHQVSNERSGLVAGSGGPSTANLLAAFDITREKGPKRISPFFVPGSIINMASTAGLMGVPNRAPYVASKWAIVGLTKTLAMELGPLNINVNAVCPGCVEGDRIRRVIEADAKSQGNTSEEIEAVYLRQSSMRLFVDKADVANMVLFLASKNGHKISGQAIAPVSYTHLTLPTNREV